MKISILQQAIEITEVNSVLVTDIVDDEDEESNPIKVREIRVYYKASDLAAEELKLTVRITADTADKIKLLAPEQTY